MKDIIIAIDGHSSCGKSTLAKHISSTFKYRYIDTGAMYRAVALYFMRKGLSGKELDEEILKKELPKISIDFQYDVEKNLNTTSLNGENVEEEIRGVPVTKEVSKFSQISMVRKYLIEQQQELGKSKRIVMDGRDIGTRVFPDAELKLFVTADLNVRAERRYQEMINKGIQVSLEDVQNNLAQRDYDDEHKGDNPLKKAADAIVLDNTYLGIQEGFDLAEELAIKAMS